MSGFCTAVAGTPGDVLKTRMIAQLILKSGTNYTSTLDCLTTTLREGGPRAMYKGFLPTVRMHACAHKLAPRLDRSIVSSLSSLLKRSHSPLPSSNLSLSLHLLLNAHLLFSSFPNAVASPDAVADDFLR
jgi:hypothetical protein